jgi:bacterioferritin
MCDNWGYEHLAGKIREQSIDEMKDAEQIIERILFLDGVPNLQRLNNVRVGETVPEQFRLDLELEREAIDRYNVGIELAVAKGDNGTRELLEDELTGEESHADWLESQLTLIDQVGVENYLATQIRD